MIDDRSQRTIDLPADERIMAASLRAYASPDQRAAMRGALADAAALCDFIQNKIERENLVRGGRVGKGGQRLAVAAKRCGDAIWAMREKVKVRDGD